MRPSHSFRPSFAAVSLLLAGCGNTTATTLSTGAGGSTSTSSSGVTTTTDASSTAGTGGSAPVMVSFQYTPEWKGVTAVTVIGGFGKGAADWTMPLTTLTADANGTWKGTAELPPGKYPYLYRITGDTDAGAGAPPKDAIDPLLTAFTPLPVGAPGYSTKASNPCSDLTVPQPSADPTFHVTGKALYGGQGVAGYVALIEREEMNSHHFFANRTDTAADGSFDFTVAPGQYRIQIQYPTLLNTPDTGRDPLTLKALRRAISASFAVNAAVSLGPVEMEYLDYGSMMPTTSAKLPTTFTYTVIASAKMARASVYGTKNGTGKSIGDPWYSSAYSATPTALFDGTFPTMQATETAVKTGEAYFWGTWQQLSQTQGTTWQGESMVFPITWN